MLNHNFYKKKQIKKIQSYALEKVHWVAFFFCLCWPKIGNCNLNSQKAEFIKISTTRTKTHMV